MVLPSFQSTPPASSLSLTGQSHRPRFIPLTSSLCLEVLPLLSCLAIGNSTFYYTNHNNTPSQCTDRCPRTVVTLFEKFCELWVLYTFYLDVNGVLFCVCPSISILWKAAITLSRGISIQYRYFRGCFLEPKVCLSFFFNFFSTFKSN